MEKEKRQIAKKSKLLKIILFILFLVILAGSISSGVYFYLKSNNQRDTIKNATYLSILEDGTIYIPKAKNNIRFQIDSTQTNSYRITNQKDEIVESEIIQKNGKNLIQAKQNYNQGETYTLELTGANFEEESFREAKKLKFKIEEPQKAEYQLEDNVTILENDTQILVQENENETTIQIPNRELKNNEIIIVKDNEKINTAKEVYKVQKVENGIATVTTPEIAEIYKEIDLYHEEHVNFDNFEINEEFEKEIQTGFKATPLYQFLVNESYAAGDEEPLEVMPKIIRNSQQLKIEIKITRKANGKSFFGIKALANHNMTLKFSIDIVETLTGEKLSVSKFDETFVKPEIDNSKKIEMSMTDKEKEIKKAFEESVKQYKPQKQLVTEEIKQAVVQKKMR